MFVRIVISFRNGPISYSCVLNNQLKFLKACHSSWVTIAAQIQFLARLNRSYIGVPCDEATSNTLFDRTDANKVRTRQYCFIAPISSSYKLINCVHSFQHPGDVCNRVSLKYISKMPSA